MARSSRKEDATRSLAIACGAGSEDDAAPGTSRAPSRNRSHRRLVENRRRLHRHALSPSRVARGNPVRTGSSTSVALRARTNLQVRDPAETETTLRRENDPRHSLSRRLILQYLTTNAHQ